MAPKTMQRVGRIPRKQTMNLLGKPPDRPMAERIQLTMSSQDIGSKISMCTVIWSVETTVLGLCAVVMLTSLPNLY